MKVYRKIFVGALIAAFMVLTSSPSQASCSIYGKIVRLYSNVSAATPYSYVYVMPQTTGIRAYAHYFYLGPDEVTALPAITAAAAANQKVRVVGDASACKTSGTWRYAGRLTSVYFLSLY